MEAPDRRGALDDSGILRRHFVAIATADYDDPSYPALRGVTKEVEDLRAWLCDTGRLGRRAFSTPGEYTALAHSPPRAAVDSALRAPERPWTDADAAVVFVTGHGEPAHGSHWLILTDTRRERLRSTGLRTSELIGWLQETGIRHLLLIIDACFAAGVMGDVADFDTEIQKNWLVLPSAMKGEQALTGALSGAIARAVAKLRGGEGAKYGLDAPYFTVEQFLETVQAFLGDGQRVTPLHGSQISGPHLCLPNPHVRAPAVAPTHPRRHELALPKRDLDTHWAPRARGVVHADATGWLFTGRGDLMRELIRTTAAGPGTTLVTGAAGSGKSAVLARLVTLSDPDFLAAYAERLNAVPPDLRPEPEAVDVAILATGKGPHEILGQLFEALAVPRLQTTRWDTATLDERIEAWTAWLARRPEPVTIVLDALDEAHDPAAITAMLDRLTGGPNREKVRLLVGVRSPGGAEEPNGAERAQPQGHPQGQPRRGRPLADVVEARLRARRLRIDEDPWWQQNDLRDYAASVLRNTPGSPYAPAERHGAAGRVAQILADRSGRSFLIARIAAASLADRPRPTAVTDPAWLAAVDAGVVGVFRDDLRRAFPDSPEDRERAVVLLRAVAFAYGRGLPWGDVWPLVANAVADTHAAYGDRDIAWLLASPMAAYLVTDSEDGTTVYRLFHDALRATLRDRWRDLLGSPDVAAVAPEPEGELEATEARIAGRLSGLSTHDRVEPPPYVRRHLVEHAHAGGVLDGRILTPSFLPFVDPTRLRPLLGSRTSAGQTDHPVATGLLAAFGHVLHRWDYRQPAANAAALGSWSAALGTPPSPKTAALAWQTRWAHWTVGAGEVLGRHDRVVFGVATLVLPDGRPVAVTGSGDDTVRMWDLTSHQPIGVPLTGHTSAVRAVAALLPPDGRPIAVTGSSDKTVRMWDLSSHQPMGAPRTGHTHQVNTVATLVMPDGRPVAVSGSADTTVRVWDLTSGQSVGAPLTGHTSAVDGMATLVLPDGRPIAVSGSADSTVRVWDLTSHQPIGAPLTGHTDTVYAVATLVLPDGRPVAVTGSSDDTVRVWDLTSHQPIGAPRTGHFREVLALATLVLPDGRPIAVSGSPDETVRMWDLTSHQPIDAPPTGHTKRVNGVATLLLPDGRPVAVTGSWDYTARVWDLTSGQPIGDPLTGHTNGVDTVATLVLPDGRPVAITSSSDRTIRVWDLTSGRPILAPLYGHTSGVSAMAALVLPDGRPVAVTGSYDRMVRVWDLTRGLLIGAPLAGHTSAVNAVATVLLPDGRPVAVTGAADNTVRMWDLISHQPIGAPLNIHSDTTYTVAALVLPDGRAIAVTGSYDRTVRVWDLISREPIGAPLTGHTDLVPTVAALLLPDGRAIAVSGSADRTVRVWDLGTGRPIDAILPVIDEVTAISVLAHPADSITVAVAGRGVAAASLYLGRGQG